MKYALILLLLAPLVVFGHTSDQRYTDGFIIDLSTAPVAPWVGEKTGMSFTFRDPHTGVATSSVQSASFTIHALTRINNKKQETVFTSKIFTIDKGGFVTDHMFTEEGTYDMHLTFIDASGNPHTAGFRKQVRDGNVGAKTPITPVIFFGTLIFFSLLGYGVGRISRRKSQ